MFVMTFPGVVYTRLLRQDHLPRRAWNRALESLVAKELGQGATGLGLEMITDLNSTTYNQCLDCFISFSQHP